MKRGDLVTMVAAGDYGKPRPALVVQDDAFAGLGSVTLLPLTSEIHDWPEIRVFVRPSQGNGLRRPSQIMVDKAVSLRTDKVGAVFGRLDDDTVRSVSRALAPFLGLGTNLT